MKKKICGIYKIENIINGKIYIGQSTNIPTRWARHKKEASNIHLKNSIEKHGIENFNFTILEECPYERLDEREIFYISKYDSYNKGYNKTTGGGQFRNRKYIAPWNKGLTKETDERVALFYEKRKKTIPWSKGLTKETDERLKTSGLNTSKLRKGISTGPRKGRSVINLTTGKIFKSISEASRYYDIGISDIFAVCAKKQNRKIAGGYSWSYYSDKNSNVFKEVTNVSK